MQAAACADGVDQGLQLLGRVPWPCRPPALQCDPRGKPGVSRVQRPGPGRCRRRCGGVRSPSLRGWVPAAVSRRAAAGDQRTRRPSRAERAVDQGLVSADGDIVADLEVGPAQLVLDLLVALPDPVPDAVDPHDLCQAGARVRAAVLARTAGRCRLMASYQVALGGRCPGRRWPPPGAWCRPTPHQPTVGSAAHQVSVCPSQKAQVPGCQSPDPPGRPRPGRGWRPQECAHQRRRPWSRSGA